MALITKIQEINAIYPTSKWDRIDVLTAPLEKVERTRLLRILGQPLFNKIVADYGDYTADPDGFMYADLNNDDDIEFSEEEENTLGTSSGQFKVDVIRTCQEIELYIMLSNNVRILSSSLNRGGGFNVMTADNYETPDERQLDALKKETWRNAMDSLEHLLLLLEQDAEEGRVYTTLWQKSRYYYQHKDLLFTTAVDMQEYLNIDESRDRYVQLVPTIRSCQEIYIATRIGTSFLNALLEYQMSGNNEASPLPESAASVLGIVKQALAQYIDGESSMSPLEAAKVTAKGMETIRQQRSDSHLNGDRLISLAIQQVLADADAYSKYITKGSPLAFEYRQLNGEDYQTPEERAIIAEAQAQLVAGSSKCSSYQTSKEDEEYDALYDLGGMHLM